MCHMTDLSLECDIATVTIVFASANLDLDTLRLGLFRLGQLQRHHAVLKLGLDPLRVDLLAELELTEEAAQLELTIDGISVNGVLGLRLDGQHLVLDADIEVFLR